MQVQHARALSGTVIFGAPRFEYIKVNEFAAHEERWRQVLAPFRLFA